MDIVLLDEVRKLGALGCKVSVKPGYARNCLIPQGKALPATEENLAKFEARRAELEAAANEKRAEAERKAEQLAELAVTITANAGDEGKLFGSIGTKDIAEAVTAAGVSISKAEVRLPMGALRELCEEVLVDIQLHSEVTQAVKVAIVAE